MKLSRSADGLAARIVAMLDTGARPARFFRGFAATDVIFEQAIGKLLLRGQAQFVGKTKGRRLARAGRA